MPCDMTQPRYQGDDYQVGDKVDPYNYGTGNFPVWGCCAKSFVILITDGGPASDGYLPELLKNYANDRSPFYCADRSDDPSSPCYIPSWISGGYLPEIEDVALYAHTNDLREDLRKPRTWISMRYLPLGPVLNF